MHSINWELLRKVTSLGPNLWLLRKVTSLNLWRFERSQVWVQTCDFCKSHNFWPKLVTFWSKLVNFIKGHKFGKITTLGKGHNFKLVTFCKGHKFEPKGHKFGPKVVTFTKFTKILFLQIWHKGWRAPGRQVHKCEEDQRCSGELC